MPTDPPLRPRDPEAFRQQVYRRASRLRRRRIVAGVTGALAVAAVMAALFVSSFLPLIRPSGGQVAIGPPASSSSLASNQSTVTLPTSSNPTSTSTSPPSNTEPPTTIGGISGTTTPTGTQPTVTTLPTTSVTTPTTSPPVGATVPSGCGQPKDLASPAGPADAKRDLVGTWTQCAGPSIFGPHSGGAVQIQANGTWRQLGWTPGGWVPLIGTNDSGTWRLLPSPSASSASTVALVRFVAAPPATAATAGPATPQQWTTEVMLTSGRHARARFVEGTIVANYLRFGPSATGGPTGSS